MEQISESELKAIQLNKARIIAQQIAKKECYEELVWLGLPIPWDLYEEMAGWGNSKCAS